jgi:methionine-rich copper-binding protein CopC
MAVFAMLPLLLLAGSGEARAHAHLDRASPPAGSTVGSSPAQVVLYFTQKLERRFSRLEVRNAAGARVDQGNVSVNGSVMRVGVKELAPGRYSVHWRVLSVDAHTTEGNFAFYVGR